MKLSFFRNGERGSVDAPNAVGSDKRPGKELDYSAGQLHVQYNEDGEMEKLNGSGNAKLVSHGNGVRLSGLKG